MGMKTIEITWNVTLDKLHQLLVKRVGGWWSDTLSLTVDGAQLLSVPAGGMSSSRGIHRFVLDQRQLEFRWVWGSSGDPEALVLLEGETVLASNGTPEAVSRTTRPSFSTRSRKGLIGLLVTLGVLAAVGTGGYYVLDFALRQQGRSMKELMTAAHFEVTKKEGAATYVGLLDYAFEIKATVLNKTSETRTAKVIAKILDRRNRSVIMSKSQDVAIEGRATKIVTFIFDEATEGQASIYTYEVSVEE